MGEVEFKPRASRSQLAKLAVVILLLLGLAGAVLWKYLKPVSLEKYSPLITAYTQGKLVPDAKSGRIDLSRQFAGVVPLDLIYVDKLNDGAFIMLFPTWYGKTVEMDGLLYSSRPLTTDDIYTDNSVAGAKQPRIDVGSSKNLRVLEAINPHWHKVAHTF